ncbi:MAG: T9SS type A sorting domain-containing protein [Candidatus Cloacimonetes bacterium]|nr:T9SS type A sorting domain-containing protein [Candidatus Cloacimonadota bacterium]
MTKKMNFNAVLFIAVIMLSVGTLFCQTSAGNRHNEITEQYLASHPLQNFNREDFGFDETTGIYRISNPVDLFPKSDGKQRPKYLSKGNDLFGFTTPIPPSGTGTQTDPYIIENLGNLRWLSEEGYEAGAWTNKYFLQTADINATETAGWNEGDGYLPIGSEFFPFRGNYDGNGFYINNLTINVPVFEYWDEQVETGFFGRIEFSTLKNMNLQNVDISGWSWIGGFVGVAQHSTIENCFISGEIVSKGNVQLFSTVGGVAGAMSNTHIKDCFSSSNIISNTPHLTLYNAVGGIVGTAHSSNIEKSISMGDVIDSDYAGYVGGIIGYSVATTIKECISIGNVSAEGQEVQFAGGIAGVVLEGSNIISCFSSGNVIASSKGNLHFKSVAAGGIAGIVVSNNIIRYCYSEGTVEARSLETDMINAGGVAGGIESSTIEYSYSKNSLYSNLRAGGIVSNITNNSIVRNSYFKGSIITDFPNLAGGLSGELWTGSIIQNCYATAIGEFTAFGLVGIVETDTSISNSFWDIDTTGIDTAFGLNNGTATNCVGHTTIEMKMQESYTGWDFEDIWDIQPEINIGYPFLRGLPIPVELLPVVNLSAGVDGNEVVLLWEAPEFRMENCIHTYPPASTEASSGTTWGRIITTFIGYEVYRDNVLLTSTPISELTFTDSDVENGVYVYGVLVVYAEGRSEVVKIEVIVDTLSLPNPVVLLTPENEAADVELRPVFTWTLPTEGGVIAGLRFYVESEHIMPSPLRDCFVGNSSKEPRNDDKSGYSTILPADTTEYTLEIVLEYETTYNWYIIAFNQYGDSIDNQVFSFMTKEFVSEKDESALPLRTELLSNFPNPFNPETIIRFNLAVDSMVSIDIYNIRGQKIKSLLNDFRISGEYQVIWEGTDNFGRSVGSGVYFYRMTTDDYRETKRMLMIK